MKEMRKRFDEVNKYKDANRYHSVDCEECPCFKECKQINKGNFSCSDMFFAYITIGKDFHLFKDSIIKVPDEYFETQTIY